MHDACAAGNIAALSAPLFCLRIGQTRPQNRHKSPGIAANKNGGRKAPVQIASVCRQAAGFIVVRSRTVPFSSYWTFTFSPTLKAASLNPLGST